MLCTSEGALTGTVSYVALSDSGFDENANPVVTYIETVIGYVDTFSGNFAFVEYGTPLATSENGTYRGSLYESNFMHVIQTQTYATDGVNKSLPLVAVMKLPKI